MTQPLCANTHGFSLHAKVRCDAEESSDLEHLCRYITRLALRQRAAEHEPRRAGGAQAEDALSRRHEPLRDVAAGIMQRLAALVPRPRLHLIRFHEVLAPHAKLRAAIVPIPAQTTTAHAADCDHAHGARARMTWARLLKRVLDFDVERCLCGGKMEIIAAIEEPALIERILTHLGLSAQPPPRTPARRVDIFQAA